MVYSTLHHDSAFPTTQHSLVDITVYHGGFHGDLNETLFVGNVDEASKHLVKTAYECMMKGIEVGEWRTPPAREGETLFPFSFSSPPSPAPFPSLSSSWDEVSRHW